jgi:hypothetical protein
MEFSDILYRHSSIRNSKEVSWLVGISDTGVEIETGGSHATG